MNIKNLSFQFAHTDYKLFDTVSCELPHTGMSFIQGKNGSGKSTLFRILRGDIKKQEKVSGSLVINTDEYHLEKKHDRERIKHTVRLVIQDFDTMLAPEFTFLENLRCALMSEHPSLQNQSKELMLPGLVKSFGIDYNTPVRLLSGGQRQILAILMVLQKQTDVMLLDEPTAALDEKNGELVMSFLHELLKLNRNLHIIIICHDFDLVQKYGTGSYYCLMQDKHESKKPRTIETKTL